MRVSRQLAMHEYDKNDLKAIVQFVYLGHRFIDISFLRGNHEQRNR